MRITMYVMNDVRSDSRVLREAATLVAAGHVVTVVGATARDERPGLRETRDGFAIVRVTIPRRWPWWFTWLRHPWRLGPRARREVTGGLRAGPRGWPRATIAAVATLISLPWVLFRSIWVSTDRAIRGPERRQFLLDYYLWWRVFVKGWSDAAVALAPVADIHHANDMETLPTALRAAARDGGRVVYDSHEIFLERGQHVLRSTLIRAVLARWERRMARQAAAIVTVSDACAVELERRFGTHGTVVVHNCPSRWTPPSPPPDLIRRAAGIPGDVPIVLCHGGFQGSRGIEQTVAAMARPGLERAQLVLLGSRTSVIDAVMADPTNARITLLEPVAPEAVLDWVSGADVDVMVIQPTHLNNIVSMPNKLFESLAAGVPVVSSDFPSRRAVVIDDPDGPLGAVCDPTDPDAIAAAIRGILDLDPESRADLRARCLRAAHERWNWETESAKLVALYASLDATRTASLGPAA